jgi:hypothetical protein
MVITVVGILPDESSPAAVCILEELEKVPDSVAVAIKPADMDEQAGL